MAEPTEAEIIANIRTLQTRLGTLTTTATSADYRIGNKAVSASQVREGILKELEYWQGLLEKIPSSGVDATIIDVEPGTGQDNTELLGDE